MVKVKIQFDTGSIITREFEFERQAENYVEECFRSGFVKEVYGDVFYTPVSSVRHFQIEGGSWNK